MKTTDFQRHPLSAAYPSMSGAEIDALAEDIQKHGQLAPGITLDGMILDGWHRYLACIRAGVPFTEFEYDGDDPVAFVESKNDNRRHMTASQRAESKLRIYEWKERGRPKSAPGADLSGDEEKTTAEIAKAAGVSKRTVEHAKAAHRAGRGDDVLNGKVSAKRAAEAVSPSAIKAKARKPKATTADTIAKLKAEIVELKADIADLKEKNKELGEIAESVDELQNNSDVKAMKVLQLELRAVKRRRDELMAENQKQKQHIAIIQKKLKKCEDGK